MCQAPRLLIKAHLLQTQATYVLAVDEVVVTKTGHETHGLDRSFSSKADVKLAPHLSFILTLLQAVKQALGTMLAVTCVVLDGAFCNNYALQMVRRGGYALIAKLAVNSALFFLCEGPYGGRGPHKQYGDKVNYAQLPAHYR